MDKTCMSYWYPRIKDHVPTPRTEMLVLDEDEGWSLAEMMDGHTPESVLRVTNWIRGAADALGGYPVFLRTGHGSGKHQWDKTCNLRDPRRIQQHVYNLVEWSQCVDMAGLPHNVWVVREMLPTSPVFKCAAYGNMPVTLEHRFFVRDGKVECWHPYWPQNALRDGQPDVELWTTYLNYLHQQTSAESVNVASMAGEAVGGGYWSIDVMPIDGIPYVTDMAEGEKSWHWPDCKFASEKE
jgi:hypothetical protein